MTREERKDAINFFKKVAEREHGINCKLAIEALEQEPCEDAISRKAVLELIADYDLSMGQVVKGIHALPSVKLQEPKTGHWFVDERPESDREIICSNCEQPIFRYHKLDFDYRPKYCPNCGAKMKGGE